MAAGTPEGDAHMEELLDQGLGMEETDHGLLRRPSLKENYHRDSLLAPDADFMTGREPSRVTAPKCIPSCASLIIYHLISVKNVLSKNKCQIFI